MAAANIINGDFLLVYDDCRKLHEALKPAVSVSNPAHRGVKRHQAPVPQAIADVPALKAALQESVSRLLRRPLRKAEPKGHGIIPLKAVHACRKLYDMVVKLARSGDETASVKVGDDEIPPEFDGLVRRFVAAIDPTHPFLLVEVEEEKKVDGGAGELVPAVVDEE